VFTPAEERQAVGGNRKSRIRQAAQQLPILRVQVNIVDLITLLADEVLVLCHERIEVLGATEGQRPAVYRRRRAFGGSGKPFPN
jgi:hypothetical protein